jgi:hypothetical protein
MKSLILTTAAALLWGSAALAQSASFETTDFPDTLHQAQVTGFDDLRQQAPAPALTWGDMPASPHQVAVLTPRAKAIHGKIAEGVTAARPN